MMEHAGLRSHSWLPLELKGPSGPAGLSGQKGERGQNGIAGPQGPQGDVGFQWQGQLAWEVSYLIHDFVAQTGATWIAEFESNDITHLLDSEHCSLLTAHWANGLQGPAGPRGV